MLKANSYKRALTDRSILPVFLLVLSLTSPALTSASSLPEEGPREKSEQTKGGPNDAREEAKKGPQELTVLHNLRSFVYEPTGEYRYKGLAPDCVVDATLHHENVQAYKIGAVITGGKIQAGTAVKRFGKYMKSLLAVELVKNDGSKAIMPVVITYRGAVGVGLLIEGLGYKTIALNVRHDDGDSCVKARDIFREFFGVDASAAVAFAAGGELLAAYYSNRGFWVSMGPSVSELSIGAYAGVAFEELKIKPKFRSEFRDNEKLKKFFLVDDTGYFTEYPDSF
ncbi:MAG: hypothetical protein AB1540_11515 [Bdellovibrionota bacterium]